MEQIPIFVASQMLALAHNLVDDLHEGKTVGEHISEAHGKIDRWPDAAASFAEHVAEALGWPGIEAWPSGALHYVQHYHDLYGADHIALVQKIRCYLRDNYEGPLS